MKKTNIALTILMALGLAACGSSGSSSSNKPTPSTQTEVGGGKTASGTTQAQGSQSTGGSENSTKKNGGSTPSSSDTSNSNPNGGSTQSSNDTSASTPNAGNTPSSTDTSSSVSNDDKGNKIEELQPEKNSYTQSTATVGGGFIIPKNAGEIESADLSSKDTQLTKVINVEDKKIPIAYTGLNGNSVNIQDATRKLLVEKGTNTLIFFVEQNDLEKRYLSTSGINKTKEMPKEGVLRYKGQSFNYYDGNNNLALDTIDIGSAEFTVDFKDKILTGTLKSPVENTTFVPVEITAGITQNTFAGSKNNVSVQGGFFGENAGELIGDYIREGEQQNAIGVFRAEKSE